MAAPDPLVIRAGELRHQVQLAAPSTTQDGFGQPLTTWPVYRTTAASIRMLSGQELFQSNDFTSASQIRIKLRWTDDNTRVGHRIFFQSHVYVIQICDNVLLRNRVLQLTCLEIDGAS